MVESICVGLSSLHWATWWIPHTLHTYVYTHNGHHIQQSPLQHIMMMRLAIHTPYSTRWYSLDLPSTIIYSVVYAKHISCVYTCFLSAVQVLVIHDYLHPFCYTIQAVCGVYTSTPVQFNLICGPPAERLLPAASSEMNWIGRMVWASRQAGSDLILLLEDTTQLIWVCVYRGELVPSYLTSPWSEIHWLQLGRQLKIS